MKCPVCNIDMIVVEHKKIELDYCVKCHGVWFDSGELELLLETLREPGAGSQTEALLTPAEAKSAEKQRKCPICGKKMKKTTVCPEPRVLIDTCPRGEGLWFDGGELGQVVAQFAVRQCGKPDAQGILSFLSDVFRADKPGSR